MPATDEDDNLPEIPEYSKAIVVREYGQPPQLTDVPIPSEIEDDAILVKVEVCSVCGTDIHLWQGNLALPVDLPVILGHEMVGRVVKLGKNAHRDSYDQPLQIGDRIIWSHAECGRCRFCVSGQPTLCTNIRKYMYENINEFPHLMGGFSEYSYVLPGVGRVRVPDEVSSEVASLTSCAFRSVVNAFNQAGAISPSDSVLIQGAGPLGLLGTAMAKLAGAKQIIVIGDPLPRLELATEFGATHTLSIAQTTAEQRQTEITELTGGYGPDLVFEFSGNPAAFAEGVSLIRPGGSYIVVGQLGYGETAIAPGMITKKNLRIIGSFSATIQHYWQALEIVRAHQDRFPFHKLITGRYPMHEAEKALAAMQAETEIKPLLIP